MQMLPSESELKRIQKRARELREKFIDMSAPVASQQEGVEKLTRALVSELGAPEKWTRAYVVRSIQACRPREAVLIEKLTMCMQAKQYRARSS